MQNVYNNLEVLDKRVIDRYNLTQDLMMENAANAILNLLDSLTHKGSVINIVCGQGNNGADGYALARKLIGNYKVKVFIPSDPKTQMCDIQYNRALLAGVDVAKKLLPCDVIIDCLLGSGFKGELEENFQKIISEMNTLGRIKIACDIPSGIDNKGYISSIAFKADYTVSMGALKSAFYSDMAKDFIGKVIVGDLGISRKLYEISSNIFLLEKSDLKLPDRIKLNSHKGDFGHLCVYVGENSGAGLICAKSAFCFGAGKVSVMGEGFNKPIELIKLEDIPRKVNVFAIGMGMGKNPNLLSSMLQIAPCVIDADMFYENEMRDILQSYSNIVLTPHLKEFASLVKICDLGEFSIEEISNNKLEILLKFSQKYPNIVILLKGANTLIAKDSQIYINTLGNSSLAKAGSGDVLAGMIGALIAQGYDLLNATISASLAHAMAGNKSKSTYSLTPLELIENIKTI